LDEKAGLTEAKGMPASKIVRGAKRFDAPPDRSGLARGMERRKEALPAGSKKNPYRPFLLFFANRLTRRKEEHRL
jgi:hypothetical protein